MSAQSSFIDTPQVDSSALNIEQMLTPTKLEIKTADVIAKTEAKTEAAGLSRVVAIEGNPHDGDTWQVLGDKYSTRATGIDAYEVGQAPSRAASKLGQAQMARQRKQLSAQLGREVTDEDVFEAGQQQQSTFQTALGSDIRDAQGKLLPALVASTNTGKKDYYGKRSLDAIQTLGGMMTLPDGTEVDNTFSVGIPQEQDSHQTNIQKAIARRNAEKKAGVVDTRDDMNIVESAARSLGGGIISTAAAISDAPDTLYQFLGGDYLEGDGTYDTTVKSIIDTMSEGSKILKDFNQKNVDTNTGNREKLVEDFASAYTDNEGFVNVVTEAISKVIENPQGALELGLSSYGFTKALGAQGVSKVPGFAGAYFETIGGMAAEYKKATGQDPDDERKQTIALLGLASTMIDTAAAGYIFKQGGGGKVANGISEILKKATTVLPASMRPLIQKVGAGLADLGVEGFQEGSQEALEQIGVYDKVVNEGKVFAAGASGAVSVPGMKGVDVAGKVIGNAKPLKKALDEKIAGITTKQEAKTETKIETPTTTAPRTEAQIKGDEELKDFAKKMPEIGDDMIPEMAKLITTYEDVNDPVRVKQVAAIRKELSKRFDKVSGIGKDTVLGSEEAAISFIEDLYIETTDINGEILQANIDDIAKANNVSPEMVQEAKSRVAVEKEASSGVRGYLTYGRQLKALKENPIDNAEQIEKVELQLEHFQNSQVDRLDRMEKAVKSIEANLKAGTQTERKVKVPYANEGEFTIHIKDGKINPATYKIMQDIRNTISGIETARDLPIINTVYEDIDTTPNEEVKPPTANDNATYEDPILNATETDINNIVEKTKAGEELTPTEQAIRAEHSTTIETRLQEAVKPETTETTTKEEEVIPDIVPKETDASLAVDTKDTTPKENIIAKFAKGALAKVLRPITTFEDKLQAESPFRKYIYSKDGTIDIDVAEKVALPALEYVAFNSGILSRFKTAKDIASVFNKPVWEISKGEETFYKENGMLLRNVSNTIGKAIISGMEVKADKSLPEAAHLQLITDAGTTGVLLLQERGYVEIHSVKRADYEKATGIPVDTDIQMVKLTSKGEASIGKLQTLVKNNTDELAFVKEPRPEAYDKPRKHEARNNNITKIPKSSQKALNNLDNMEHTVIQSTIDYIKDNIEQVKASMGYKTDKEMQLLTVSAKDSQIAKNRQIDKSIQMLNDYADSTPTMYFDWFFSKNGRYFIDSNTINPQADTLHRHIIVPSSHNVEVTGKEEMFLYAVAQAFGEDVDKMATKDIISKAEALLKRTDLREELANKTGEFNLPHMLQGIEAVEAFQKADGKKFKTNISAEYDGLTSGFGIKLMQFPSKKLSKWYEKVGVILGGTTKGMNDIISEDVFYDSYQTLAKNISKKNIKGEGVDSRLWKLLREKLPEVSKDGEVSKELRTLFKDPFMTFNYAAGFKSIKTSLANVLMEGILNEIAAGNAEYKRIGDLLGVTPESLRTQDLPITVQKRLLDTIIGTYGKEVEKILTSELHEFIDLNKTINASFRAMYKVFSREWVKVVNNDSLSLSEKREEFRQLQDKFPIIKGPSSDLLFEDGIAINTTTNIPVTKGNYLSQTQSVNGRVTVQSMLKDYDAAVSAGSVIPIHYIDGAVIEATVNAGYKAQYIHDAVMPSVLEATEVVKTYNEAWYNTNKDYSILQELTDSLTSVVNENKNGDLIVIDEVKNRKGEITQEEMKLSDVLQALTKENTRVGKGREWLYSQKVSIGQMVGTVDTMVDIQASSKPLTTEQIAQLKDILFTKQGAVKASIKKYTNGLDLKDC